MTQHEGVLREEFKVKLWAFIAAWADGHIIDRCNRVVEIESLIENHYRALASRVAELEGELEEVLQKHWAEGVLEQRLADAQAQVSAQRDLITAYKHSESVDQITIHDLTQQHATLRERLARIRAILETHWITAIDCDHDNRTDTVRCACSVWTGTPKPSVGEAVKEWVDHIEALATGAENKGE